jgi:hypothetical protein
MPRPKGYRISPGENPGGRPSALENDPKLQERIAECFLLGLTDEQTALDCDISERTIRRLRNGKFCPAVKKAELAREKIYRQKVWDGKNGWQGTAWFLERKYASQFARPEILLAVNQQVSAGTSNIIILGPERARVLASRHEQIRAKTRELLDARKINAGNGQGSTEQPPVGSEPVAAVVPAGPTDGAPTSSVPSDKPASWWRPFIFGGAVIPKAEAILAVRMILNELRITADERALDFGTDNVVKSTFSKVLEQLSGSDLGWRTMVQIYEREQARERICADY